MKDQAFYGKYFILRMNVLAKFKRTCDSSRIQDGSAVSLFWYVMNGLAFAAINA